MSWIWDQREDSRRILMKPRDFCCLSSGNFVNWTFLVIGETGQSNIRLDLSDFMSGSTCFVFQPGWLWWNAGYVSQSEDPGALHDTFPEAVRCQQWWVHLPSGMGQMPQTGPRSATSHSFQFPLLLCLPALSYGSSDRVGLRCKDARSALHVFCKVL